MLQPTYQIQNFSICSHSFTLSCSHSLVHNHNSPTHPPSLYQEVVQLGNGLLGSGSVRKLACQEVVQLGSLSARKWFSQELGLLGSGSVRKLDIQEVVQLGSWSARKWFSQELSLLGSGSVRRLVCQEVVQIGSWSARKWFSQEVGLLGSGSARKLVYQEVVQLGNGQQLNMVWPRQPTGLSPATALSGSHITFYIVNAEKQIKIMQYVGAFLCLGLMMMENLLVAEEVI